MVNLSLKKRKCLCIFSRRLPFPKKSQKPKTTILNYTSHIYSKPVLRDSKIPDNVDRLLTKTPINLFIHTA